MRIISLTTLSLLTLSGALIAAEDGALFESKILPLLKQQCFDCHSHATKIKGGLALDSKSGWQKGGDHGMAIVPGKPNESLFIKAVKYQDKDMQMPPKKKLSAEEIALLERWIQDGAHDPRVSVVETAPKKGFDFEGALKHWAFQPIKAGGKGLASIASGVEVDRYTLLRRVSLDLTGLPPTRKDIEAFVSDTSPNAFAKVVDRLLASSAYGERWARHWLDLVGYADQVGTANNVPAPHAWRYRDYVIRAFNADKPFDTFIHEQLAGDLMKAESTPQRQDQITATGFLILGNMNIVEVDKAKLRVDMVDQQIEKVGKAFLGMTLNCARCHDHKFDPVTLDDYYGLAGIFMSTETVYQTPRGVWSAPTFTELPKTKQDESDLENAHQEHQQKVAEIKAERETATKRMGDLAMQIKAEADKAKRAPMEKMRAECEKQSRELENRLLHLDFVEQRSLVSYAASEVKKPADTHITIRGNPHALGRVVPRGFVQAAFAGKPPGIPANQSGRLQLADWVTDPNNRLTARVTVNRLWQKLFGQGIVRSVDYFGLRGEKPADLELLDTLAARFMQLGWSQKRMIREVVLSGAYRSRSVSIEPNNTIAQNCFRLDAEAIRDSVLMICGSLVSNKGGPALALEYPENVSGLDPKSVNPVAFSTSKFRPVQANLRTVYLPVVRSSAQRGPSEMLDVFDFVQPAVFQGQRSITTVAPQALYLMNGPLVKNEAGKLGDQLWKGAAASDEARLEDLYLRVLNRPITPDEARDCLAFLATFEVPIPASEEISQRKHQAWALLCHALFTSNEFLFRL